MLRLTERLPDGDLRADRFAQLLGLTREQDQEIVEP
jgi:hypothetical protein